MENGGFFNMYIKNYKELATTPEKKDALSVIEAGLVAANPIQTLQKIVKQNYLALAQQKIPLNGYRKIAVIAIGKAAGPMTKAVMRRTTINHGIVVSPQNGDTIKFPKKIKICHSSHPIPDQSSIRAAQAVLEFIQQLHPDDFVIFLISGGASSLLELPDEISLRDLQKIYKLLINCGANIEEINCVRKHLSKIKSGKLVEHLTCAAVSLVISDHVKNDLSVIASGITYCDKTTFKQAQKVLQRYQLDKIAPKSVIEHIRLGIERKIPETPKQPPIKNYLILTNTYCLQMMAKHARALGYRVKVLPAMTGNVATVATRLLKMASLKSKSMIIFGGEPTVVVKGKGRGGRNQELALHCLNKMKSKQVMVSVGTDGIDGPTDAAGAIVSSDMPKSEIKIFLDDNNSYAFFKKYGGLIYTGPTQTNVVDIGLILSR